MENDNFKVFKSLQKYMKAVRCWPREEENFSSMFIIKAMFPIIVFSTPILLGMAGHLYKSISVSLMSDFSEKYWSNAINDLFFLLDYIMFTICGMIFFNYVKKLQDIMQEFARHKYGIPKNFEKLNTKLDKMTNMIYYYTTLAPCCFLPFWCIWEKNCLSKKDSEGRVIQGYVKGLTCPAWFPFDSESIPWRLPIFISNVITWIYYGPNLSCPIIIVYGFVKLTVDRLEHLADILKDIDFLDMNQELTQKKFRLCMKYYSEIILLWKDVNNVIGLVFAPTQNGTMALILGLLEYGIIVHEQLTIHVYDIPWYEMNTTVRNDYKLFHALVQKTLQLKIEPNNRLNMVYYSMVMKGAYSLMMYLTNF
ncbi:hypothetical protein WA026_002808 [Henosepilachna vigintioctopunctata]|uniref:Odorant receptor n=1 Tax=Henosepilachna vigintioctopunctata TaxID=420089 RepID=A0AAW1TVV9_9CUCU